MADIAIISVVSITCLVIAYIQYMKKELVSKNLGTQSGNGSGEGFYGRKDIKKDGSYIATKWFMILLIPILPLGTYRVWKGKTSHGFFRGAGVGITQSTEIRMERLKIDWQQVISTYFRLLLIVGCIILLVYFLNQI